MSYEPGTLVRLIREATYEGESYPNQLTVGATYRVVEDPFGHGNEVALVDDRGEERVYDIECFEVVESDEFNIGDRVRIVSKRPYRRSADGCKFYHDHHGDLQGQTGVVRERWYEDSPDNIAVKYDGDGMEWDYFAPECLQVVGQVSPEPTVAESERSTASSLGGSCERILTSPTGGEKGDKLARFDLIPTGPWWEVAEHYGRGAEKYDERNWEKGYDWHLSYAAMQRHAQMFWGGEDKDPETGSPHLAAVVFHALALMEYGKTHPEYDDRPSKEK